MKIVNLLIENIVPYWNNARRNHKTIKILEKGICEYGFNQPLVVVPIDNGMYEIVVGHARYFACRNLGFTEIPCYVANNLTSEEAKKYRIADNKTHEHASWDESKLIEEIRSINDKDLLQKFLEEDIGEMLRIAKPTIELSYEEEVEWEDQEEESIIPQQAENKPSSFCCPFCSCKIPME